MWLGPESFHSQHQQMLWVESGKTLIFIVLIWKYITTENNVSTQFWFSEEFKYQTAIYCLQQYINLLLVMSDSVKWFRSKKTLSANSLLPTILGCNIWHHVIYLHIRGYIIGLKWLCTHLFFFKCSILKFKT